MFIYKTYWYTGNDIYELIINYHKDDDDDHENHDNGIFIASKVI